MGGQNANAKAQQALGNTAAATSQGTANTFGGQQQGLFSTLLGKPGGAGGGTITPFMQPSSLNVNAPTGPYALQYQQAKAQGASDTGFAKQAIDREAGAHGFTSGAPTGYTGFLKSQADLSNAGNTGQLFSQFAGKGYQDALSNFWKANQMAGTAMGQAGNEQNTAQGQTNQAYSNLYSSTPKTSTLENVMSVLGPVLSTGGQVGAAALCVCADTLITLPGDDHAKVSDLQEGMHVKAQNGLRNLILKIERMENVPCVLIQAECGFWLECSESHTISLALGGYAHAKDAAGQPIHTSKAISRIYSVTDVGKKTVYRLLLDGSHDFCSDGIWSLE